jgi:TRAP-type C4-dicarboxylate transport system permease small subunit
MVEKAKTFSNILRRSVEKFAIPLGALSSVSTIVMMVAITVDVVARNFAGEPIPGLLEISETALVATVFLGISYAGVTNAHVSVDLLTSKLSLKSSRVIAGVMWLFGAGMVIWFIVATAERAMESTEMGEVTQGLLVWPVWPTRWLIVFGFIAFLVVALANVYLSFRLEPLLGEDDEPVTAGASETSMDGVTASANNLNGTEKKE